MTEHRIAITFENEGDLLKFARHLNWYFTDDLNGEVGVYKADVLDPEFKGNCGKHAYVVRPVGRSSKDESMRVA